MKKRVLSLLLCLVMALSLIPTMAFAETPLPELRITSSITSVKAGELPYIDAEINSDHAYVEHNVNTCWSKLPAGGAWQAMNGDKIAVNDGSTRYSMRLCIDTRSGYSITEKTKVYYNGKEIPDAIISVSDWGAFVRIDLGLASGVNVSTHTVTFDYMHDNRTSQYTVLNGKSVNEPSDPIRDRYTFDGWYKDKACTTPFNFDTVITADTTIYAKWNERPVLPELRITGSITSVTAGELPAIDAKVISDHAYVEYGVNTVWSKQSTDGVWRSMNGDKIAVNDGSTRYGMRLCVDTTDDYAITEETTVYYNGKEIPNAVIGVASWGAFVRIDLGLVSDEHITHITQVNITGVKTPVAGEKKSDFLNLSTADPAYKITDAKWDGGMTPSETFEAGDVYYLNIYVRAADGYCMSEDTKLLFNDGDIGTDEASYVGLDGTYIHGFTVDLTIPDGPAAPSISISNNASTGKPKLTWKAVNGATQYEVYRATSKTSTYYSKLTITSNLYLNNTSAVAGTTYYYKVRALNADGVASEYSNIAYITCDCAKPVVKVSANSNGKPYLSWAKVDGATSYEVYYSTSKTGTYSKLYTTSNPYLNHNSAEAGKTYYYKVLALSSKSSYATSAYSDVVSFTCKSSAPAAPSISISNNTSTGKPRLSWKAVSGAAQYEVYRATSKTGTYTKLTTTSNLYLNNTSAVAGTTYYYKVRALNANGTAGEYSNIVYITCDCAKPVVSIKLNSSNHPYLSWAKVDGATSYEVYYATSAGGEFTKLYTTSNLYLNHNSAKAGTTYYYKVLALSSKSSYATSAYSDVVSIKAK